MNVFRQGMMVTMMVDLKEANVYPGLAAAGLVAGDEVVPITDHNTQHVTCRHVAMSSHSRVSP